MVICGVPLFNFSKEKFNLAKFADIRTDGKKVTPKNPLRINARDLKKKLEQIEMYFLKKKIPLYLLKVNP